MGAELIIVLGGLCVVVAALVLSVRLIALEARLDRLAKIVAKMKFEETT